MRDKREREDTEREIERDTEREIDRERERERERDFLMTIYFGPVRDTGQIPKV